MLELKNNAESNIINVKVAPLRSEPETPSSYFLLLHLHAEDF